MYRFDFIRWTNDREGYYVRKDRTPIAVVAETKDEAVKKVWALSGDAPRGRYFSVELVNVIAVELLRLDEVPQ